METEYIVIVKFNPKKHWWQFRDMDNELRSMMLGLDEHGERCRVIEKDKHINLYVFEDSFDASMFHLSIPTHDDIVAVQMIEI